MQANSLPIEPPGKPRIVIKGLLKANSESLERREESWRRKARYFREFINDHEQNVGRNIDCNGHSHEVSDENEELVIGQWRNGDPCYKGVEN